MVILEETSRRYCVICDECNRRAYDETYATVAEATSGSKKEFEGWEITLNADTEYQFRHVCPSCQRTRDWYGFHPYAFVGEPITVSSPRIHPSNIVGTSGCITSQGVADLGTSASANDISLSEAAERLRTSLQDLYADRSVMESIWESMTGLQSTRG